LQVSVEYNVQTYEKFFQPVFLRFPALEQTLLDDFKLYKETQTLPHYFGRDTLYDRPEDIQDAKLWHLHLAVGNNKFPAPTVPKGKPPVLANAATLQWSRTSNSCLVYTQHLLDETSYSLIALFHPYAHADGRDYKLMRELAQVSRDFRCS